MRDIEREAETQAVGEAGSRQGTRHGTGSWISRILPWAEGGAKPLKQWGCPLAPHIHLEFPTVSMWQLRNTLLCGWRHLRDGGGHPDSTL